MKFHWFVHLIISTSSPVEIADKDRIDIYRIVASKFGSSTYDRTTSRRRSRKWGRSASIFARRLFYTVVGLRFHYPMMFKYYENLRTTSYDLSSTKNRFAFYCDERERDASLTDDKFLRTMSIPILTLFTIQRWTSKPSYLRHWRHSVIISVRKICNRILQQRDNK